MLNQRAENIIKAKVKRNKRELSLLYKQIEAQSKIQSIVDKYDMSINFHDETMSIHYYLKKDEAVSRTAWQIFEEIDEVLETEYIEQQTWHEYENYDITSKYRKNVRIRLAIHYSASERCKVVEETKTVTVNKLVCDE